MKKFLTILTSFAVLMLIALTVLFSGYSAKDTETIYEQRVIKAVKLVDAATVVITATQGTSTVRASGVIVSETGDILTSRHVISPDAVYSAQLFTGANVALILQKIDTKRDIALLQIKEPTGSYEFAPLIHDKEDTQLGHQVIIGGVIDDRRSIIKGMIAGLNESLVVSGQELTGLMQIDAPIQSGMSGGPALLLNGDLIGITTAYTGANGDRGWATPVSRSDLALLKN